MNTFFLGHRVTISVKVLCFPPEEPPPSRLCSAQRRPQDRILWAPRPLSQGSPANTQPSAHPRLTPSHPAPESSLVPAPPCLGLTGESHALCRVSMMGRGSGVRVGSWVPPLSARCSRAPHGIQVLETCVKNCGHRFHVLVASQDFVEGVLVRTILPKNNPPTIVHDKVLTLIQVRAGSPGQAGKKVPPSVLLFVCLLRFLSGPSCSSADRPSE